MPRFVILEHDHPTLHWDIMLELGGVLKTWRLPAPPPEDSRQAISIGDHRLAYLDYEGPVSGQRGTVKRWDAGTYETLAQTASAWMVRLRGARWHGVVTLEQQAEFAWKFSCAPIPES